MKSDYLTLIQREIKLDFISYSPSEIELDTEVLPAKWDPKIQKAEAE